MRKLKNLSLADLKIGLDDLLGKRHKALVRSKAGKVYEASLSKKRDEIADLPPALVSGKPLVSELSDTDARHDGFGAAIWFLTEAYLRAPDVLPDRTAAARRIREAFVPKLDTLKARYATEADAAKKRRKALKERKEDLKLFPLAGGGTLYDWAKRFLDEGEKLHELLSTRADQSEGDRSGASKLRTSTIALLNRLRTALADESAHNDKLPKNVDAKVFGYLDELESLHPSGARVSGEDPTPPAPPPEGDPGSGGA